mgnify:CR=1 FL=1
MSTFIQYGVFYLDRGWPESEARKKYLFFAAVWLILYMLPVYYKIQAIFSGAIQCIGSLAHKMLWAGLVRFALCPC